MNHTIFRSVCYILITIPYLLRLIWAWSHWWRSVGRSCCWIHSFWSFHQRPCIILVFLNITSHVLTTPILLLRIWLLRLVSCCSSYIIESSSLNYHTTSSFFSAWIISCNLQAYTHLRNCSTIYFYVCRSFKIWVYQPNVTYWLLISKRPLLIRVGITHIISMLMV